MSAKVWLMLVALSLGGCRIVSQQALDEMKNPPNPRMANVAQIWRDKLVPQVVSEARPATELLAAFRAAGNIDSACNALGYRAQDENPCVFAVRVDGTVEKLDTGSRSGRMTVRQDNGERIVIQIGPTLRGTVLRDGYRGAGYQDFNDQVLFGEFGRAINEQAVSMITAARLKSGEQVQVEGVFSTWDLPQHIPDVTPVRISHLAGGE